MDEAEGFFLIPSPSAPSGKFLPSSQRDAEAARMMALGWHEEQVAESLGYGNSKEAVKGAQRAMAEAIRFARDEQRFMELRGLNEIEYRLWQKLDQEVVLVQHGKMVFIDGVAMIDERFSLEVMDRILHVKKQRCDLLGLNAPTRAEVYSIDGIEAEIQRLRTELGVTG